MRRVPADVGAGLYGPRERGLECLPALSARGSHGAADWGRTCLNPSPALPGAVLAVHKHTESSVEQPSLEIHEDMIERAARVLDRSYDRHEMTLQQVAREVLEAAFEGVPITNYGIGLALQFFDLVICVKSFEMSARAGVYRKTGPGEFEGLPHTIDASWGFEQGRHLKRVAISGLPAPDDPASTTEPSS